MPRPRALIPLVAVMTLSLTAGPPLSATPSASAPSSDRPGPSTTLSTLPGQLAANPLPATGAAPGHLGIAPGASSAPRGPSGQQEQGGAEEPAPGGEQDAKKVLTIDEYGRWRSVVSTEISDDGDWVSYGYRAREADDELFIENLLDDTLHEIPRGRSPRFSDDSRWVAHETIPGWEEVEELEEEGDPVPVRVELRNLDSGEVVGGWDDVASFAFADGSRALAIKRKVPEQEGDDPDEDGPRGTDLIVRYLVRGYEELLGSVDEWSFNEPGTHLAYTVDADGDNGNGVYLVDLRSGLRRALDNGEAEYARLTWDEDGGSLAVLKGTRSEGYEERDNVLLVFPGIAGADGAMAADALPEGAKRVYDPDADPRFPEDFVISERGAVAFDVGADRIFFGIKEQRQEPEKTDEPIADVNIFHWQDERIQTVQKVRAERDRDFTYRSVLNLGVDLGDEIPGRFVRLADERMRTVNPTRDGRWAVGEDDVDYISDWKRRRADYYRVDTMTGERTQMLEGFESRFVMGLGPESNHLLYWKGREVWTWDLDAGETRDLTSASGVDFTNTEWDYIGEPPAWGVSAWTEDGGAVILRNQYDLWLQPLDGGATVDLTAGAGARDEIRLRLVSFDEDARRRFPGGGASTVVDLSEPQTLSAFGRWSKKDGWFELPAGGGAPRELVFADKRFARIERSDDAERYYYTVEDFRQFPDYWVTDATGSFESPTRVTEANPWQEEYFWGDRILFEYTNDSGVRLQGILAVPETREPGERLPMIVRFYEKMSDQMHVYPMPQYRHSPNFAGYVSAGYMIMQPDVHFSGGSSHSDMLESVEAATRRVIDLGYADPEAIGLSGHSYSGGGSSYIAARSDMFAAVASGAAPINLTSEFNQLFLGSGQNNHGYDIYGQGRYGTNPYDDPELYRRESPITWVRDMDTPLLYLHGEEDRIVGWVQGIEWYNALRFNDKPIIFLSYPGEGHGLRKYENQIDFQRRLRQFFDHHLRGEPAPKWMTEGVTYLEKQRQLERRQEER